MSQSSLGSAHVFIGLKRPHAAITNKTVSEILKTSIKDAGLGELGFTPRSFRPTGATAGIQAGINPGTVPQIGRWKNETVFYERYVYPTADKCYSSKVLQYTGLSRI